MTLVHNSFYQNYFNYIDNPDKIIEVLKSQLDGLSVELNSIPSERLNYRYQDGKWSVKQVLIHCLDTERVMAYRALAIVRNPSISLSGYDQDVFANNSADLGMDMGDIQEDFIALRKSTLSLIKFFKQTDLNKIGVADGAKVSVHSLLCIIAGHWLHHIKVLKDRYF